MGLCDVIGWIWDWNHVNFQVELSMSKIDKGQRLLVENGKMTGVKLVTGMV